MKPKKKLLNDLRVNKINKDSVKLHQLISWQKMLQEPLFSTLALPLEVGINGASINSWKLVVPIILLQSILISHLK